MILFDRGKGTGKEFEFEAGFDVTFGLLAGGVNCETRRGGCGPVKEGDHLPRRSYFVSCRVRRRHHREQIAA